MKQKQKKYYINNFLEIPNLYCFSENLNELPVIIGIDPGLGITENSYTAIQFLNLYDSSQVLEYEGKINHIELVNLLDIIISETKIIPKLLVIERNNFGKLFIDEIIAAFPEIELFSSDGKQPGFLTTKETKEALLIHFIFQSLKENPKILRSKRLYAQIQSLYIDQKTNKLKSTTRTDLLMAFGFALIGRLFYIRERATSEEVAKIVYMPESIKDEDLSENVILPFVLSREFHLMNPRFRIKLVNIEELIGLDEKMKQQLEKMKIEQILDKISEMK